MSICVMLMLASPEMMVVAPNPMIEIVEPGAKDGVPGRRIGGGTR